MSEGERVTPRSEDYAAWYNEVVRKAELAEHAPVRGCMVIRPYGYALWENVQRALDARFRETGHSNAYFPLFIPESFIAKEAEHVEGFSPELAVVTHGGGKRLEEPLIVRPTSETIINASYAKWVRSYRDLPILINQWSNVVRWELRTRPFLRTLEFLWQEGHTAHATHAEAEEEARRMLGIYREFYEEQAAIPVIIGRKTESERFAGADVTYTVEAMMGDRRALQGSTSHNLGQNFAKAFGIRYLDQNNELQNVWQTSWGLSTRSVGAVVMVHGDDRGLILPPRLAPIQLVVVPIGSGSEEGAAVRAAAEEVLRSTEGLRSHLDDREEHTPGWKFHHWEQKGVPLRLEVGPRDVAQSQVILARRDTGDKETVQADGVGPRVEELLGQIQASLYQRALEFLEVHTHVVDDYEAFQEILEGEGGFLWTHWCGRASCESKIKTRTKATIRAIPFPDTTGKPDGAMDGAGNCVRCGRPS
ncbi:MAG: proline--tRNA ligase, partial [Anaerolineae bacterium]